MLHSGSYRPDSFFLSNLTFIVIYIFYFVESIAKVNLLGKCESVFACGSRLPLCRANIFLGMSFFLNHYYCIFLIVSILVVVQFELRGELILNLQTAQFELCEGVHFEPPDSSI